MASGDASFPILLSSPKSQRIPLIRSPWLSTSIQRRICPGLYFVGAACRITGLAFCDLGGFASGSLFGVAYRGGGGLPLPLSGFDDRPDVAWVTASAYVTGGAGGGGVRVCVAILFVGGGGGGGAGVDNCCRNSAIVPRASSSGRRKWPISVLWAATVSPATS